MYLRKSLVSLFAVVVILFASATAAAAQSYSDTISGHEYYFTSTDGRFAGTAFGTLPGSWNADVRHTPLCLSCSPTATITGGSFALATTHNGSLAVASGTFVGGTVQVMNVGSNCTEQTFAVRGILGSVGWWFGGSGTGTFSVTLTHYRRSLFGSCVTYGASVK